MHDFQDNVEWHLAHSAVKTWLFDSPLLKCACRILFKKMYNKQLLDSVSVISVIIKVSVGVSSLSLRLRLMTLTSALIIPDITKTASNLI